MLSEEIMSKEAFEELIRNLEIVASLTLYGRKSIKYWVTKLQKENEYWKNGFERELEANRENTCELLKQDLMIKEKDKQIHLMAEYIDEIDVSEVICGEKIICDENCKDCIKQYFETKAKKGE